MRFIIKFPEYQIENASSVPQQKLSARKLRQQFNRETTLQQLQVYVKFCGNHSGHLIGEGAEYFQIIDQRVINKINELVAEGVTQTAEVQNHLKAFVKPLTANPKGRRFKPSEKDVRNHVMLALKKSRCSTDDQLNLQGLVNSWKEEYAEDNFFFQPSHDNEGGHQPMLFVHQTKFQQHLLSRYGSDFVLMDSTYKVTRYDVPLFLICVAANVGYFPVAFFMTERETTAEIADALKVLQSWNPSWHPHSFMTDMDHKEIHAIECTFSNVDVYTCDFHREQAWQRWLKRKECKSVMEEVLIHLRRIASSRTEEEYSNNVHALQVLPFYTSNEDIKKWLENYWFPEKKRWVYCFRRHSLNVRITTTNGVEGQHKLLKYNYLRKVNSGRTLSSAVKVLVQEFIPDGKEKYFKRNLECLEECKKYSKDIPLFLKNRPKQFVLHILERVNKIDCEAIETSGQHFKVQSQDGTDHYICDMVSPVPSCSCIDYARYKWPCKHMVAVMTHYPAYSWEFLSETYTNLPCFNLDETVTKHTNINRDVTASVPIVAKTENEQSVRQKCLNVSKLIQNGLYLLTSTETLKEVHRDLVNIDEKIQANVTKTSKLPVRNKHGKRKHVVKDIVNEEEALDRLWKGSADDTPVVQIGSYLLSRNSFHFLKSTLSDEVIDAYMTLLVKNRNVLYINCINATNIFERRAEYADLLRREKFEQYDYCMAVVNEGGFHWVLIIIMAREKRILYINPLGERRESFQVYLHNWEYMMAERVKQGIDEPSTWYCDTLPHSRQTDSISCGVYVLKFAENFMEGKPLVLKKDQVLAMRRSIGRRLLTVPFKSNVSPSIQNLDSTTFEEATSLLPPSQTHHNMELRQAKPKKKRSSFIYNDVKKRRRQCYCVCNKPEDGSLYWQCEKCGNWFHPECIGLSSDCEPPHFVCEVCKGKHDSKDGDGSKPVEKMKDIGNRLQWSEIENHLKDMVQCSDKSCAEPDHARHHSFIKDPFGYSVQERKMVDYGKGVYDDSTLEWFHHQITSMTTYHLHPKFPATSPRVLTVDGLSTKCRLYNIFVAYGLGYQYAYIVLFKEAVVHSLCLHNLPYEEADRRCRVTEHDYTSKKK